LAPFTAPISTAPLFFTTDGKTISVKPQRTDSGVVLDAAG
jgi:hypothetical protein